MRSKFTQAILALSLIGLLLTVFQGAHAGNDLPDKITDWCTHASVYNGDKIPGSPGWANAYHVSLPEDVQACAALIWSQDDEMYYFGFDRGSECQDGFCIAGMAMWKFYNDERLSFWWEPRAMASPATVKVYYRQVDDRETVPPMFFAWLPIIETRGSFETTGFE